MNELLKIVRHSNLFDLNHLMDAIESVNDAGRTAIFSHDNNMNEAAVNKDSHSFRRKTYRGRLSKNS